jgi:hypothetical protein
MEYFVHLNDSKSGIFLLFWLERLLVPALRRFPSPTCNPRQSVLYNFHILRCFRGVLELVITLRGDYNAGFCVCSLAIVIPTIPRRVIVYNVSFPSMKFNHIWKNNWQVDGVCKWFVFTHDGDLLHKINQFEWQTAPGATFTCFFKLCFIWSCKCWMSVLQLNAGIFMSLPLLAEQNSTFTCSWQNGHKINVSVCPSICFFSENTEWTWIFGWNRV